MVTKKTLAPEIQSIKDIVDDFLGHMVNVKPHREYAQVRLAMIKRLVEEFADEETPQITQKRKRPVPQDR